MSSLKRHDNNMESRFNSLFDEINEILKSFESQNGISKEVNIIKKDKIRYLYFKINDFIELKFIVNKDTYPKESPLMEILYSKVDSFDEETEERIRNFFKTTILTLNQIVDRNHSKLCIDKVFKELKQIIEHNEELMVFLQPIDTFSAKETNSIKKYSPRKEEDSGEEDEKVKLKGADIIFQRIKWDEAIDKKEVIIGYLDRFKGIMEINFNDFKGVHEDYKEGIPLHRIRYYKINNKIVWDREKRVDLLTGKNISEYCDK
jgi:uncharacterized protein (UPF0248 family)